MSRPEEQTSANVEQTQSAEYIADLTTELAKLARQSRLDLLAYLLDVASLEAKTAARRSSSFATVENPPRIVELS